MAIGLSTSPSYSSSKYLIIFLASKLKIENSKQNIRFKQNTHYAIHRVMKPVETLFWLGTAGILYMTANNIVKNVTRDIVKDIERKEHRRRCICW